MALTSARHTAASKDMRTRAWDGRASRRCISTSTSTQARGSRRGRRGGGCHGRRLWVRLEVTLAPKPRAHNPKWPSRLSRGRVAVTAGAVTDGG
eukprot:16862-Chlamydomonas_euryale.AAC.3